MPQKLVAKCHKSAKRFTAKITNEIHLKLPMKHLKNYKREDKTTDFQSNIGY